MILYINKPNPNCHFLLKYVINSFYQYLIFRQSFNKMMIIQFELHIKNKHKTLVPNLENKLG